MRRRRARTPAALAQTSHPTAIDQRTAHLAHLDSGSLALAAMCVVYCLFGLPH